MLANQVLLLAVAIYSLGAIATLFVKTRPAAARLLSGYIGIGGSLFALLAAILAAIQPQPVATALLFKLPVMGAPDISLDGLASLMIGMISLLGLAASVYALARPLTEMKPGDWRYTLGFFTNIFLAMMLLVVSTANAFYFLIFWEVMTLASYFLILGGKRQGKSDPVRAGYLYILVAHAGGALIMLAFFILHAYTGTFEFSAIRQAQFPASVRHLVFLLTFIGFGAKAGMVPLHFWMPGAYAAAPSESASLMASVMKKTAIYGILRFCIDLMGGNILWWGLLVLSLGALSAVFGILFALTERDLKRLLAYSSVENVGIILMGIGVGMIGLNTNQPAVALLGFLAALYHSLNHSFFKGLLFLGAGTLERQAGSQNLNQLGGLARRMPWTALGFLTGALAVVAIPPLNGFASEWYTYQALFAAASGTSFSVRFLAPLCAVALALVGALAAMVFIKAYAGAFSGPATTPASAQAEEAPPAMVGSMLFLALGCLALGLGAPLVVPYLGGVVAQLLQITPLPVAAGVWVISPQPGDTALVTGSLSTPLTALLLLGLLAVPWLIVAAYGGRQAGRRIVQDPWTCGYGYHPSMSIAASSFDQPAQATFNLLFLPRLWVKRPLQAAAAFGHNLRARFTQVEPVIEKVVTQPAIRFVAYLGDRIQTLAMGDIRVYCLYIILTLAILLVIVFR